MLPIGDDRHQGGPAPLVTIGLVVLNVLAFLLELSQPSEGALQSFIQAWGVVPREYAAATGSLAVQSFDILHEYASGLHASECPSRFVSARFRPSTGLGTLSKSKGDEPL